MKTAARKALLGIALDRDRFAAVEVSRRGGKVRVRHSFSAPLSVDLLTGDPELAGSEIRNLLRDAGVRERRCVVCLPLGWTFTLHVDLQGIPEGDVADYLSTQVERELPMAPQDLVTSVSHYDQIGGIKGATLVAVSSNHWAALQAVLKRARLSAVAVVPGVSALVPSLVSSPTTGVLSVGRKAVDLAVFAHSGFIVLRRLVQSGPEQFGSAADSADVLRQLRISLAQMPAHVRQELRALHTLGGGEAAQRLAERLAAEGAAAGMPIEPGVLSELSMLSTDEGLEASASSEVLQAFMAVVRGVAHGDWALKLVRPKVSRRADIRGPAVRRLVGALLVAMLLALGGVVAAFLAQAATLGRLEEQWSRVRPEVELLRKFEARIDRFKPWFGRVPRALDTMRQVTDAFPAKGVVYATTLQLSEEGKVAISGRAQTQEAWLETQERLREIPGVELRIRQQSVRRGQEYPVSFALELGLQDSHAGGADRARVARSSKK